MTLLYVSGAGTDSSEKGRTMWARVKGKTENAILRLSFKAAYMFRPGVIQPLHRIQSKTASYCILYAYAAMNPFLPLLRWLVPQYVTTTEILGRAMIQVAQDAHPKRILESGDINLVARASQAHSTMCPSRQLFDMWSAPSHSHEAEPRANHSSMVNRKNHWAPPSHLLA